MSDYRYAGRETIDGLACHRIEFSPGQSSPNRGIARKFAESMSGTIWLTEEGLHLARASARTTKPILLAPGLARVSELQVHLVSAAVRGGSFLPRRITMRTGGHVVGVKFIRRYVYEYDEFAGPRS